MLLLSERKEFNEEEYSKLYSDFSWRVKASIRDIIKRTFLNTADTTYLTARWQFINGMGYEFFWSANHAIEKYLKAVLLYNGIRVKNISHNILKAFKAVERLEAISKHDLLPSEFSNILLERIPEGAITMEYSGPSDYFRTLEFNGGSESRYASKSHHYYISDLYYLDLTVFLIRRLAFDLADTQLLSLVVEDSSTCLDKGAFVENLYFKDETELRLVLEKCNYFMVPNPDTTKCFTPHILPSTSNTALFNNIFERSENISTTKIEFEDKISKEVSGWVLNNIRCSKDVELILKEITAL